MVNVLICRTEKLSGFIEAPPSKSYTHRAIIASALSKGTSKIFNPLFSDDTLATINACKRLGVFIEKVNNNLKVKGKKSLEPPKTPINCRLSAATLRFMTAVASLAKGKTVLTGEAGLLRRPVGPLVDALNQLGVSCESRNGYPPVTVYGGSLIGGETSIVGDVSSQFISSLLFISPLTKNKTKITLTTPLESKPYVQLTLEILKKHKVKVKVLGDHEGYLVNENQRYQPYNHKVPGDFSSASFLMAAAAITGSQIKLKNLNVSTLNQPDMEILNILKKMGVEVSLEKNFVTVKGDALKGISLDAKDIPDLVPVCVVLACYAEGETRIKNVRRLRIKESDRVEAITSEIIKMGGKIHKIKNELIVEGPCKLRGATINPYGDHRIAMACTIAALGAEGKTKILNVECIKKSYPNFLKDLKSLGGKVAFVK